MKQRTIMVCGDISAQIQRHIPHEWKYEFSKGTNKTFNQVFSIEHKHKITFVHDGAGNGAGISLI